MKRRRTIEDNFLCQLQNLQFTNAFNPYLETCAVWDKPNGPQLRQQNLKNIFQAAVTHGVEAVWIGRDLGYRGGRRTGLALTDEVHLDTYRHLLKSAPLHRATKGPAVSERTALIVWRMLQSIQKPTFLWNIFPLHPHEANDPLSNRSHSRAERIACRAVLVWVLQQLNPRKVIAIGRDAQSALAELGIETMSVRHPSYGGQNEFISGLESIYSFAVHSNNQPKLEL